MKTKAILIKWSNPIRIEDAIENSKDMIGLYYITRSFKGVEKSLYVGRSDTSVISRLVSHNKNWVHEYSHSKIWVRFGKIIYPRKITSEIIDHAEKALIYEHGIYGTKKLIENTQFTKTYRYKNVYKVINTGNHFELKRKVDMNDHEDA